MTFPQAVELYCEVDGTGLADVVRAVARALSGTGVPAPESWRIPISAPPHAGDLEAALAAGSRRSPPPPNASADLGNGSSLWVYGPPVVEQWTARLTISMEDPRWATIQDRHTSAVAVVRKLIAADRLVSASAYRIGGPACLPIVPIIGIGSLTATTVEEVADAYDNPDAFWSLDWATHDQDGAWHIVTRAPDAADSAVFLRRVIDGQWELARVAAPGGTRYAAAIPEPDEEDSFFAGEPRLNPVGLITPDNIMVYACYLGDDEHIHGWEVFALHDVITQGELEDGRPVEQVQVNFAEREMAEREKRPLLDIGAAVFYQDEDGELVPIED